MNTRTTLGAQARLEELVDVLQQARVRLGSNRFSAYSARRNNRCGVPAERGTYSLDETHDDARP